MLTNDWHTTPVAENTLADHPGQLGRIAMDLVQTQPHGEDSDYLQDKLAELLFTARMAFHKRVEPALVNEPSGLFYLSPKAFEQDMAGWSDKEAVALRSSYGAVWMHESPTHRHMEGDAKSPLFMRHLEADFERIEAVADLYLAVPEWRSDLLEWAIINATLYQEGRGFAPLATNWSASNAGAGTALGLRRLKFAGFELLRCAFELAKLGATALFAFSVSQEDRTAGWLIFLSITFARWMYPTASDKAAAKKALVLESLLIAHNQAARVDFDALTVRRMLHRATDIGGVYPPYAYAILAKRLRRQS